MDNSQRLTEETVQEISQKLTRCLDELKDSDPEKYSELLPRISLSDAAEMARQLMDRNYVGPTHFMLGGQEEGSAPFIVERQKLQNLMWNIESIMKNSTLQEFSYKEIFTVEMLVCCYFDILKMLDVLEEIDEGLFWRFYSEFEDDDEDDEDDAEDEN